MQQDRGERGAELAAGILRDRAGRRVRPARVATMERGEDEQQVSTERDREEPLCLAQEACKLRGERCARVLVCRRHHVR